MYYSGFFSLHQWINFAIRLRGIDNVSELQYNVCRGVKTMATASVTIRMDEDLKREAEAIRVSLCLKKCSIS